MSKILIVSYTPRHDSNSAKLLQSFINAASEGNQLTLLDLVDTPAPLLGEKDLNALVKRNFMGMELTPEEAEAVRSADQFMEQVLHNDKIVLAYPMYNFCVPGGIKAWFDLIIQNGKTFRIRDEGGYEGLCQGKDALVLMTAGGDYSQEPAKAMNFATPVAEACLGFMGISCHSINAFGLNQYPDKEDEIVQTAKNEIARYLAQSNFA